MQDLKTSVSQISLPVKILVLALALLVGYMFYMNYTHTKEKAELQDKLIQMGNLTGEKEKKTEQPKVAEIPANTSNNAWYLSGATGNSLADSVSLAKQVNDIDNKLNNGKTDSRAQEFVFKSDLNTTISTLKEQVKTKADTLPPSVRKADSVVITTETDKTTGETKVKLLAVNNYEPSIYIVPQLTPNPGKRFDAIYTNRDFLLDVNYDNDRKGDGVKDKLGVSVGWRVVKW